MNEPSRLWHAVRFPKLSTTHATASAAGTAFSRGAGGPSLLGPRTAVLLGGCAVVFTAAHLGANWLTGMVLGLPVGIWLVAGGLVGAVFADRRNRAALGRELAAAAHSAREVLAHPPFLPTAESINESIESAREKLQTLPQTSERFADDLSRQVAERFTGRRLPRLAIGLDLPPEEYVEVVRQGAVEAGAVGVAGGVQIDWVPVEGGQDDAFDCARLKLDAIIRRPGVSGIRVGGARVTVPEAPGTGHEAAWPAWSERQPARYASVFPPRIDTAHVDLGGLNLENPRDASLAAHIAVAAALAGRSLPRLRIVDRLFGRASIGDTPVGRANTLGPLSHAMLSLGALIEAHGGEPGVHHAQGWRAAARAVQAWLSMWDGWDDAALRLRMVRSCDAVIGDEPESSLRLAAALVAAGNEDAAVEAMSRTRGLMQASGERPDVDPLAFVLAELNLGTPTHQTLGRVAAGIALAWACSPGKLEYMAEDLLDDLHQSSWFVGRETERRLLESLVRRLSAMDSAPAQGVPALRIAAAA